MRYAKPTAIVLLLLLLLAGAFPASGQDVDGVGQPPDVDVRVQAMDRFRAQRPGAEFYTRNGRISRVFGRSFSHGASPQEAAERFLLDHARMFGVQREELLAQGPFADGRHVQPIMYEPGTDSYKFTGLYYSQQHAGIPVFRSQLMLLVRNEANHPLVLASADLRPLDDFQLDPAVARQADEAMAAAAIEQHMGVRPALQPMTLAVWAGANDVPAEPRLAMQVIAEAGDVSDPATYQKMLYLVDSQTGEILFEENQVVHSQVSGTVSCLVSDGDGADTCHGVTLTPMPYARVSTGTSVVYADAEGNYEIPAEAGENVESRIWGKYFRVFNQSGSDAVVIQQAFPPNQLDFTQNAANANEQTRAEVNAYVFANEVRDFVLQYNPDYPVIADEEEFTVNVNISNNCNAFYNGSSINFYTSGGGCTNTAAATVVYHEYGHHLVNTGGSGQGTYGEGMSDCISVIITDNPVLGSGFNAPCGIGLRNADNDLQYPCSGGIHFCGQVLSGCVWDTRNELAAAHPSTYRDVIASLTINSILLHTGTSIDPSITIDFLTLDDDDDDIFNGTPHYVQINAGFGAHNMPAPPLDLLSFNYPNDLPEALSSTGATTIRVEVQPLAGSPVPGTGVIHYRMSGELACTSVAMQEVSANVYDAVLPALPCGDFASFYVSAEASTGETFTDPKFAPNDTYVRASSSDVIVVFADEFDGDLGWIAGVPDDDATTGHWVRANPVGTSSGGQQAQPNAPFIGSACYITGQHPGGGAGANDVDFGKTTLVSPVIDLSSSSDAMISYWRWYSNHAGANPYNDVFVVDITNNGVDWVNVETVGPAGPQVEGGWYRNEFAVSQFVTPTSTVQVRFVASDYDPQALVEAAVDAFEVVIVDCTNLCPADLTGDGAVDVSDLLVLLGAWGPCGDDHCPADFNSSGTVDVSDLLILLGAWGACE